MTKVFLLFFIILMILSLFGCETTGSGRVAINQGVFEDSAAQFVARHLPISELNRRYGVPNPYVAPQLLATPFEYLVFDLSVISKAATISIAPEKIKLDFGRSNIGTRSKDHLENIWRQFITNKNTRQSLVDGGVRYLRWHLFPQNAIIAHDDDLTHGYIVFRSAFPEEGTATIKIPYSSGEEERIATMQMNFQSLDMDRSIIDRL